MWFFASLRMTAAFAQTCLLGLRLLVCDQAKSRRPRKQVCATHFSVFFQVRVRNLRTANLTLQVVPDGFLHAGDSGQLILGLFKASHPL